MSGLRRRTRRTTEKLVEAACDQLFRQAGCEVVRFSQPRNTMQTPGIPDRKVYHRGLRHTFWFEVKAPDGKQSADQIIFQMRCEAVGEVYVVGGLAEAEAYLVRLGLAEVVDGQFTLTPGRWKRHAGKL